jgi:hypothetical protein
LCLTIDLFFENVMLDATALTVWVWPVTSTLCWSASLYISLRKFHRGGTGFVTSLICFFDFFTWFFCCNIRLFLSSFLCYLFSNVLWFNDLFSYVLFLFVFVENFCCFSSLVLHFVVLVSLYVLSLYSFYSYFCLTIKFYSELRF